MLYLSNAPLSIYVCNVADPYTQFCWSVSPTELKHMCHETEHGNQ